MRLTRLGWIMAVVAAGLCGCDWEYQDSGRFDSDADIPANNGGNNDGECEVHAGDSRDSIEIEWVSDNFARAGVGSEVEVRGEYALHSRDYAQIHALSCGTAAETLPVLVERGSGEFSAGYSIIEADQQREQGCLLVLMYSLDSEKLLSCRFRWE